MIETFTIDPNLVIKADREDYFVIPPQIIRVEDIEESTVSAFADSVSKAHQSGQSILPIIIDSGGGDIYAFWAMVDILATCKIPIATIIEGKAMSCGAALATCGTNGMRYVGPHATIMIHDVHCPSAGEGKTEDIKADAAETERLNKALYGLIEKNTHRRRNTIWKMVQDRGRSDWYLTPSEAVKLGIVNHIGVPTFRTVVSVETILEL